MKGRFLGGILFIVGTSLGGGMLALPLATAAGGFVHAFWLLVSIWLLTMISAFYILEVNLALPEGTNMVSMARQMLGPVGQYVTWIFYLLLLYTLLSAYTAGGADLVNMLFESLNLSTPHWLDSTIFVLLLGTILFHGIRLVDWFNRSFMGLKFLVYVLLVVSIFPFVKVPRLFSGHWVLLAPAVMVGVTSFGYATIIPSLRSYLHSHVGLLRLIIGVGSCVPLICYLVWNFSVQGALPVAGAHGLAAIAQSNSAITDLVTALSVELQSRQVSNLVHTFTYVCILTSFLGVALGLMDFLSDGLKVKKEGRGRWAITLLALGPPLLIILFEPGIFIKALAYAGICCVVLLILLPTLMAYSRRYWKKQDSPFALIGGLPLMILELIASVGLLTYGFYQLF